MMVASFLTNKTSTFKSLIIFNKIFCSRLTEIKSIWLVLSEAGDAVCGVV